MATSKILDGIRFGSASALVSAVVLLISIRPIHKYRVLLIVTLLTIALIDSLADAYAIWAARSNTWEALFSLVSKVVICGLLALMVHLRVQPRIVYAALVVMVVSQIVFTALTHHDVYKISGIFAIAVVISLGMNRLVNAIDKKHKGQAK
jgi:hypothetical protein